MSDLANNLVGRYVGSGRSEEDKAGFLARIGLRLGEDGACRLRLEFDEDYRPRTPKPWGKDGTWRESSRGVIDVVVGGASLRYRFDAAVPHDASVGRFKKQVTVRGLVPVEYRGSIGLIARPDLFLGVDPDVRFDAWARSTERVLAGTTLVDGEESAAAMWATVATSMPASNVTREAVVMRRGPDDETPPLRIERGGQHAEVMRRILGWFRGS